MTIVGPAGPATLDPHAAGDAFTISILANFYEPLVKRDPDLDFRPGLARDWEWVEPTRWRFRLREDARFHNGTVLDAADVVHSFERSVSDGSRVVTRMSGIRSVDRVDAHTVDIVTDQPQPLLLNQLDAWLIVGRDVDFAPGEGQGGQETVNGTGPFVLIDHNADVGLTAEANPHWWRDTDHNIDRVEYRVASADQARFAAMTSGTADIMLGVPVQTVSVLDEHDGIDVIFIDEPRAVFLGLIQRGLDDRPTPLADERVRRAVYHAIDIDTILSVVMHGQGREIAAIVAPKVTGYPETLQRRRHDPDRARDLLDEAGYPDGLRLPLDCSNDRYINDEAICTAIAGMLERVGINVQLRVEPAAIMIGRLFGSQEAERGIFMIGWLPSSLDSGRVLADLVAGSDPQRRLGSANITGFSDPDLNSLIADIQVETDLNARNAMMVEAWHRVHEQTVYVPLHQQQVAWAVRSGVSVVDRADGILLWNGVRLPDDPAG